METQNLKVEHTILTTIKALLVQHKMADLAMAAEINRVSAALSSLPAQTVRLSRSRHAITGLIGAALGGEVEANQPLLGIIAPLLHFLPWRRTEGDLAASPYLMRRAAIADVVGHGAPFPSSAICIGFVLIASNTLCPSHHHPDFELYHAVTGHATWVVNGVSQKLAPGSFIVAPPQAVHAIHTESIPALAIYARVLNASHARVEKVLGAAAPARALDHVPLKAGTAGTSSEGRSGAAPKCSRRTGSAKGFKASSSDYASI